MRINKVTFTGIDDNTPVKKLQELQLDYPFIEFGVLISTTTGRNRYPSLSYIMSLKDSGLNLALHLCGGYSKNILQKGVTALPITFFNRYQLNFNFNNTEYKAQYFGNLLRDNADKTFILQFNKSNSHAIINNLLWLSHGIKNINLLYDSSGGRGNEIKEIRPPFSDIYTGYSGGINIDNIDGIINLIKNNPFKDEVWIDMESGVRTNDKFDLKKVEYICRRADEHISIIP